MKKEIFIVNIDNYMPEVFELTHPTVQRYANKIGAKITLITERKNPTVQIPYEKTQIYELGRYNDWNILIDADIAISNMLPDVTTILPPHYIGVHMSYPANINFPCNKYFARDGRGLAIASDFMVAPESCHDVFTPLDAGDYIEIKRPFILDEYCFSTNVARYGLRIGGIIPNENMIFHLNPASPNSNTIDVKPNTIEQLRSYCSYLC